MDDDMMLNITRTAPAKPSLAQSSTSVAKENKRSKYSVKERILRQKAGRPNRRSFQYNLLPTDPPANQAKPDSIGKEAQQQEGKFKRAKHFQKQPQSQNNKLGGSKRIKLQGRENGVRVANASEVKVVTPEQIKPEVVSKQGKIDINPLSKFALNPVVLESLIKNEITTLTNIQISCFQPIFSKKDVIAKASTGSGKTLAYLIPLINQYIVDKTITKREDGTAMIVICPSRQLCLQGQKQAFRCLKRAPFIVPGCLIGGEQTKHEKNRLRKGITILFSTPGRLIYHLKNTKSFKLQNLKTVVFEEADRTLDMGFHSNVKQILAMVGQKLANNYVQKILVSAHFNEKVQSLIKDLSMQNAKYIGFEQHEGAQQEGGQLKEQQLEAEGSYVRQEINTSKNLKQKYVLMTEQERIPLIIAYLQLTKDSKVLIFVNTIDEVEYLDFLLNNMYYRDSNGKFTNQKIEARTVYKIHGNLDQKYRSNTYFQFRREKAAVMVSTEVASRGLDFPDLNHIILFDVPATLTDYGNRVGRSARFNSSGVSLLMLHYQESDYAEQIRYYCPTLQAVNKQVIFDGFSQYLGRINIAEESLYYIEGIVRSMVKDDSEKYDLARKAYTSMLRAYAKLKNKHIFAIKRLDLKLLGRCFGINSTGGKEKRFNSKAKESHLQAQRKKRKVQSIRSLQISQYL